MSKNRLFLTKPLPQLFSESKESGGLKRTLTALNLTTLGIGAIMVPAFLYYRVRQQLNMPVPLLFYLLLFQVWLAVLQVCATLNLLQ